MLTPQEVAEHGFSKSRMGGYNMKEVDDFLDELTADFSELYKENSVLKGKIKVLAEKISEYRETEDAMRTTLLTAQKMANSMVVQAEEEKKRMDRGGRTRCPPAESGSGTGSGRCRVPAEDGKERHRSVRRRHAGAGEAGVRVPGSAARHQGRTHPPQEGRAHPRPCRARSGSGQGRAGRGQER